VHNIPKAASVLAALSLVGVGLAGCTTDDNGGGEAGEFDLADITSCLGLTDADKSAEGMDIKLGAALAYSGPGAVFGVNQGNGIDLAVEQIAQIGGPNFQVVEKDIKSGDPTAGVQAVRDFEAEGVALALTSYIGDLGAMQEPLAQNQILGLDGGGGTGVFAQGLDYFWGMRAVNANDNFPGVVKFIQEEWPDASKVSSVVIDQGPANALVEADGNAALEEAGLTPGAFITSPVGTTDWGSILQQLRDDEPDVIWAQIVGDDPGYFMKQYATSGLTAPVFIFEYTQPAADIAAGAYNGVYFAFDNFDVTAEGNCWTDTFIQSYRAKFGTDPDYYAANYYEDTFAAWDLIRRVQAAGGDITSGEELQAALVADPNFASLYGGDAGEPGVISLDTETHTVTSRQLSISLFEDDTMNVLKLSDIGGADYRDK
jgi:branched-chain amino acid transport system substrate-binding protein